MKLTEIANRYYHRLTDQDLEVLRYIQENRNIAGQMTTQELADACYISRASIFRFLKRMNLNSFAELKILIKKEQIKEIETHTDYQLVLQKYYNYINTSFEKKNMEQLAKEILKCRILYVYGTGNEQKLQAEIIQSSLSNLGINVVIFFDFGEYNYFKHSFMENDLLLLISYKGENTEAIHIMKDSQFYKIHTIVVTKTSMNTMAKLADYQILVPTESIDILTERTYEINTTFYLTFDQLFYQIQMLQIDETTN